MYVLFDWAIVFGIPVQLNHQTKQNGLGKTYKIKIKIKNEINHSKTTTNNRPFKRRKLNKKLNNSIDILYPESDNDVLYEYPPINPIIISSSNGNSGNNDNPIIISSSNDYSGNDGGSRDDPDDDGDSVEVETDGNSVEREFQKQLPNRKKRTKRMREYDDIVERAFEDDGFVVEDEDDGFVVEDEYDAVEDEDYAIEEDAQIFMEKNIIRTLFIRTRF